MGNKIYLNSVTWRWTNGFSSGPVKCQISSWSLINTSGASARVCHHVMRHLKMFNPKTRSQLLLNCFWFVCPLGFISLTTSKEKKNTQGCHLTLLIWGLNKTKQMWLGICDLPFIHSSFAIMLYIVSVKLRWVYLSDPELWRPAPRNAFHSLLINESSQRTWETERVMRLVHHLTFWPESHRS